jgi:hypothetical protein
MLALMATVEAFVKRHDLDTVPLLDWQYLQARQASARVARTCDLLILGDSQTKLGILPRVVGERSQLRAHNLAIAGAQAPASYDVLRRALGGGGRPSAVVVDFHPLLLALPPRTSRADLPFLLDFGAALRLGWAARDPVLLADLLTRRALPSLRCRTTLVSWVRSATEGQTNPNRLSTPRVLQSWARNDGAWLMSTMGDRPEEGVAHYQRAYPPGWTPDRVNADYLRRFLELAEANRVTVYWLIPPTHPAIQVTNATSGFDDRYVAFVRRMQQQYTGVVVIDGRRTGYDPGVFVNPDHLGPEGAFALSQDLGDLLGRLGRNSPPGRWVALPPYRPRAAGPEVLATARDGFQTEPAPSVAR